MNGNPLRRTALISLCIAFFFAVLIFVPESVGIDGFDGGFAISFVSLVVAIVAGVVAVLYFNLAHKLDVIFRGEGILAHWVYSFEYWHEYTQKEYVTEKAEKKVLFLIVTGFALFFGFLFWTFDPEAGFYVFLVMLGLIGLVAFAWQFSVWHNYKQNIGGVREAYITKDAVYLNRKLYAWKTAFTRFNQVTMQNNTGLHLLVFKYTITNPRTGPQTYTTRVPIPPGEEENAKTIMHIINQHN